jgi:hypothetical protein
VDNGTEARIVAIIDRALADVAQTHPVPSEVVDVLLDLRLRVLELAVFDSIEAEEFSDDHTRHRRAGLVGLMKRQA